MYTGNKNVIKVQGQKLCILIFSLEIHIVCIEKVVVKSFGVIDILNKIKSAPPQVAFIFIICIITVCVIEVFSNYSFRKSKGF